MEQTVIPTINHSVNIKNDMVLALHNKDYAKRRGEVKHTLMRNNQI